MEKYKIEDVYEIIKSNGPISFHGLGKLLQAHYEISEDDWWGSKHCIFSAYLSNLSKNGLIKNMAPVKDKIRKTPPEKIWVAAGGKI